MRGDFEIHGVDTQFHVVEICDANVTARLNIEVPNADANESNRDGKLEHVGSGGLFVKILIYKKHCTMNEELSLNKIALWIL